MIATLRLVAEIFPQPIADVLIVVN